MARHTLPPPIRTLLEQARQGEPLRLWTIQTAAAWRRLQRCGVLKADGRRVIAAFRPAYQWMGAQMTRPLPSSTGRYPLWVWAHPKPDLRQIALLPPGTLGVRLELRIPASRILLADFESWHCVLNGEYLGLTEHEDEAWEQKMPHRGMRHETLPPMARQQLGRSWERIFDLPALHASSWTGPVRYVQGVTNAIRREDVIRTDWFQAR